MAFERASLNADIRTLAAALRFGSPAFDVNGRWLTHRPTRHRLRFARDGRLQFILRRGFLLLTVSREQALELTAAYRVWRQTQRRAGRTCDKAVQSGYPWQREAHEYGWTPQTPLREGAAIVGILIGAFLIVSAVDAAVRGPHESGGRDASATPMAAVCCKT